MKDYYNILGVEKGASKDDIKKAFHKLAHKYHPDKKGGDEAKFKEVSEAYRVLSDDTKRSQYDTFGNADAGGGFNGFSGFQGFDFSNFTQGGGGGIEFDLGDIFGDVFGMGRRTRSRRGRDISIDIELDFKEAIFGAERTVLVTKTTTCATCKGDGGKPGSGKETCKMCNGNGKIHDTKTSVFGSFSTVTTCPTCHGKGETPKEKCEVCKGVGITRGQQEVTIRVPGGINDGEMVRLSGAGEAIQNGTPGDLYVKVHVSKHALFHKEGNDLVMDMEVKLSDALLGAKKTIETLEGTHEVTIPAGVKTNDFIRIKEAGAPFGEGKRGNLLIKVTVHIPEKLSRKAKEAAEKLREEGL